MNIKLFGKNLGVILFANFLGGCASQLIYGDVIAQEVPSSQAENQSHQNHQQSTEAQNSQVASNSVPFISQQQEYMYKILVAEMARLRGNHTLAATYFFEVALKARDWLFAERATKAALLAQEFNMATQAAQLWITLDPTGLNGHQILASILLIQKRTDEAIVHLEAMLKHLEADPQQFSSVVDTLLEQHPTIALELVEKWLVKRPNHSVILLTYSRLLIQANQLEQALNVLQTLLTNAPEQMDAVPLYAYLLDRLDQTSLALQWMVRALSKYPNKQEWRLMYARMLADAEQFEEAIKQFKWLLSIHPQHGDILYALGILSLETGQMVAATGYFMRLLESGERVNMARYYLGIIAQEEKNLEQALYWYHKVEGSSNYLKAQAQIALVLLEQGHLEQAIKHLQNVPVANIEDKISLIQMEAELLTEQKRYQQALDAYHHALELKPDDVEVLYMRALLHEKMGNIGLLEQDLRRVLVLDPENVGALNALGYSFADQTNRYQDAYELIKKALSLKPSDYYILDSMGWVLYKMGNYAEAIAYLRKAQAQHNDPEISAHLGEVLWKSGDQRAAKEVWEKAQITFPNDEKLRQVIQYFMP